MMMLKLMKTSIIRRKMKMINNFFVPILTAFLICDAINDWYKASDYDEWSKTFVRRMSVFQFIVSIMYYFLNFK